MLNIKLYIYIHNRSNKYIFLFFFFLFFQDLLSSTLSHLSSQLVVYYYLFIFFHFSFSEMIIDNLQQQKQAHSQMVQQLSINNLRRYITSLKWLITEPIQEYIDSIFKYEIYFNDIYEYYDMALLNVKLAHATEIQSLIKSFIKLVNQQLVAYNNLKCTIEKTTIKHLKDRKILIQPFASIIIASTSMKRIISEFICLEISI